MRVFQYSDKRQDNAGISIIFSLTMCLAKHLLYGQYYDDIAIVVTLTSNAVYNSQWSLDLEFTHIMYLCYFGRMHVCVCFQDNQN